MPLYDYCCSNGHSTELLRTPAVATVECPACSCPATRASVHRFAQHMGAGRDWSPQIRDNGRLRTPVAERAVSLRQFREASEQLAYEHERTEESAQQQLPIAPLWQRARRRARRLAAAGIRDSLDYDPRYAPRD